MLESVVNTATLRNTYKAYSSRRRITCWGSVRLFGHNIKNSLTLERRKCARSRASHRPGGERQCGSNDDRQKFHGLLIASVEYEGNGNGGGNPFYTCFICIYLLILLGLSILLFQSFRVRSMIIMGLCRQRLQAAAMSKRKPP